MKLTNWLKSRLVRSQKARRLSWHSQRTRLLERLEDRSLLAAQDITGLGAEGWLSDDTRSAPSGTDLVGIISTHAGKPGQVATTADDLAIAQQLKFVSTTAFPGATYGGAVSLAGTTSNSGKTSFSTIDVATGLATADELIDPAFSASYQWLSQGTRTSPLKFGIQSTQWGTGGGESQNGFMAIRSGESAWDLILVHDLTTPVANVWNTSSATANSGNWFLFAQAGNSYFSTNYNAGGGLGTLGSRTLSAWNTLPTAVLGVTWGNLLFDSGAIISSVQFGVGSGQSNATNLVDYVDINFLNGGDVIDFGSVQNTYVDLPGDFTSTFDADNSGTLTNGDRVTWNGPAAVPNLTYGLNAFGSIQAGIDGVAIGGTVHVAAGTYNEDVLANKTSTILGAGSASTVVSGPIGGVSGSTFTVTANNVDISGFTITRNGNNTTDWNNPNLNVPGVAVQGQAVTGMVIHDNLITGNRTGIDVNNSNGHTIRNNVITDNRTGFIFRNQTDNMTVVENEITNNWTVGVLFLDAGGVPPQTALNGNFSNNDISGNWYGQIVDRQTVPPAGTTNLKNFSGNWFGTRAPVITTANSTEPGYAAQIPVAFGGTATPPGGQPDIAGPASANFDITPLLGTAVDTDVETSPGLGTFGFQGDYSDIIVTSQLAQTGLSGRIQEGIDVATSGGTVHILAGSYSGDADATGNSVILSPGSSPAQVTINGNLTLDGDDSVVVEINGLSAATDYDNLIVTGTVSLGGAAINLSILGSFVPANGSVFTLIDGSSPIGGTFSNLADGSTVTLNSIDFLVDYQGGGDGNNLTLTSAAPTAAYVGENSPSDFTITNDTGAAGLSSGDTVTWNPSGTQHAQGVVAGLTFGYEAFTSVQSGVNAVASDGVVYVEAGTYSEQLNVTKSVSLDGSVDGLNNPTTILTINAPGGGNLVTIQGAAFADSKIVGFSKFAFLGNGANNIDFGVRVESSSRFEELSIDNSTFTNFDTAGIFVFGASTNAGISVENVVLTDLTFTNNGYQNIGGAGDINFFEYNGDASLSGLVLSNIGTGARGGIQMRGVGLDGLNGTDILPMGTVSFDDVDISGKYRTYFVTLQRYSNVSNLSFNDVALGSATSELTGTFGALLRFDAVGTGTTTSPATVDLSNTYFRGLAGTSALPTNIEFAPDNVFAFLRTDATDTRWDTTTGTNVPAGSLTLAELFEVEDRILHFPDLLAGVQPFKGFADVRANNAYVTATIPGSSIQRAVDIVTSPGTVNVKTGSYSGNVDATAAGRAITLAAGSSPGQVTINGNLALNSNDTLAVELNSSIAGTGYDQLIVNGTVALSGATLAGTGTRPANDGDVLVLIKNDLADVVAGTFQGQSEGSMIVIGGVTYLVTYIYNAEAVTFGNGNDVALIDVSGVTTPAPGTITLVTDPCDPSKVALVIAGTSADDNIDVKLKGKDQVEVKIDPKGGSKITMTIPLAAITGHIIVYGLDGDDHISIANKIDNEAWLFGGLGNDHLQAGDGNSVLVGGDGDDHLHAGKGRDLLIGGDGKDHLHGKDEDDILIAGTTDHDNNFAAICAIMDEWTSGNNYNLRRGNLAGLLNAGTVHDDGDEDKLDGHQGLDWFFANVVGAGVKDKVNGVKAGEVVEDI